MPPPAAPISRTSPSPPPPLSPSSSSHDILLNLADNLNDTASTSAAASVSRESSSGLSREPSSVVLGVSSYGSSISQIRPKLSKILTVMLPAMDSGRHDMYQPVRSDVVDHIVREVVGDDGDVLYEVEFACGRQETVTGKHFRTYENGQGALERFLGGEGDMESDDSYIVPLRTKKRARLPESEDDFSGGVPDLKRRRVIRISSRQLRIAAEAPRSLRSRQIRLSDMASFKVIDDDDEDELVQDRCTQPSDSEEDGDWSIPVVSDILPVKRGKHRSLPTRLCARKAVEHSRKNRKGLDSKRSRVSPMSAQDSSIELEAPRRRSGRSTRCIKNMQDEEVLDDEPTDADGPRPLLQTHKIASLIEVFQPLPADSEFAAFHSKYCEVCRGGINSAKGPLIFCQACSFSFHRSCIGFRRGREHIVTKIGPDSCVLQCRACVGVNRKKDPRAPRHDLCQSCGNNGSACIPFSTILTAKQEETLREENNGQDPATDVSPDLVNNAANLLFRCKSCRRAWHFGHLPPMCPAIADSDADDDKEEDESDPAKRRLSEYGKSWKCNTCLSTQRVVRSIVAWRPTKKDDYRDDQTFHDLDEDAKEYLVRWKDCSYAHCTWVPGTWLYTTVASHMRLAFSRRALTEAVLFYDTEAAVPQDFILPDTILDATMKKSSRHVPEDEQDLATVVSNVRQIYVKFKGLGYDDVVWDVPPSSDNQSVYGEYVAALKEFMARKRFQTESQARIRQRVQAFREKRFVKYSKQPDGLKRGKLMEYQVNGVNWLLENYHQQRSVVLADEMGLGKTVQVIAFLTALIEDEPKCWPFLIVVPNATCPNWRREIRQWCPDMRAVAYHGGRQAQELAYQYELFPGGTGSDMKAHVVIMSYDSAQDDRTRYLFRNVNWAGLIVDEGQRLKNEQTILYSALKALKVPFRVLLTGTPLQNNKRELFNLLQFINKDMDAKTLDQKYSELTAQNIPELLELIRPYFLRRTKVEVLGFLKPMTQIIVPLKMSVVQEKLCKSIMSKNPELIRAIFADSKINKKERGNLNNILVQLRKCLCHPFIYSDSIEDPSVDPAVSHRNLVAASAKLILLEIMLPKLRNGGHRVLIFSQFLRQLDVMEDFMHGLGFDFRRLDGSMSSMEKQRRIDDFNTDWSIFAFLLSTRAGGVGINLATADTVIIMDPDFNPHKDIQALSRAHRIGQQDKVLCMQLMVKNSVEEKIMQVGCKKMALDHALIETMDDENIAVDDIESILRHGAQALFREDQKDQIHYDSASVDKLLERARQEDGAFGKAQFTQAKIWGNGDLDGTVEQLCEAPPLAPSVWESILAEREAEAKKVAEMHKEVLGRGGRRRTVINYKTPQLDPDLRAFDSSEPEDEDQRSVADVEFEGESEAEAEVEAAAAARLKGKDTAASDPSWARSQFIVQVEVKADGRPDADSLPESHCLPEADGFAEVDLRLTIDFLSHNHLAMTFDQQKMWIGYFRDSLHSRLVAAKGPQPTSQIMARM